MALFGADIDYLKVGAEPMNFKLAFLFAIPLILVEIKNKSTWSNL